MNIIILSGERPNCSSCGMPLPSWNPLQKNEECKKCESERFGAFWESYFNKLFQKNTNEGGPPLAACENTQIVV